MVSQGLEGSKDMSRALLCERLRCGRFLDDHEGARGEGDVAARVVVDADLPDRGAVADVKGFGLAVEDALPQPGDEVDLELDGDDFGAEAR